MTTRAQKVDAVCAGKPSHATDEDCGGFIDADDVCTACQVWHGDPCPECHQRAYHAPDCSRIHENRGVVTL